MSETPQMQRRGGAGPMRFAYADPPYPGQAKRLYGKHRDFGGEVDHGDLIARLVREYPDGWALSTGAKWLQELLAICPPGVRVLAWCKKTAPPMSVRVQYSWEPVILSGGRPYDGGPRNVWDSLVALPPRFGFVGEVPEGHVIGAKPVRFARWIFECLGACAEDTLDDLFPGSGGVGREWDAWCRQGSLLDLAEAVDVA